MVVAFLADRLAEWLDSHEERDAMRRRYDEARREHGPCVMEAEEQQEEMTRNPPD
ncbi:MAG: hypothetical protein ACRELW_02270 [Candidatus Rokuibacteriota bacterium]